MQVAAYCSHCQKELYIVDLKYIPLNKITQSKDDKLIIKVKKHKCRVFNHEGVK